MSNYTEYDPDSPDAIKAEIERTRNQMSNKIDTLQDRLHPDNLKQQAQEALQNAIQEGADSIKQYVQENTMEIRNAVIDSFKQNPIPTALVGIGLGWILLESLSSGDKRSSRQEWNRGNDEYNYGSRQGYPDEMGRTYGGYTTGGGSNYSGTSYASESSGLANAGEAIRESGRNIGNKVQGIGSTVKETASTVKEKTSQAVEQVQDTAGQIADQVSDKTQQLSQQTAHLGEQTGRQMQQAYHVMEENPLVVAAAALALGAVIGLVLPATRRENEMVGDMRDQLMEKGKAVASDMTHRVKEVVEEAKPEIQQMANRVVEELKPEAEQLGRKVVGDLKEAGNQAMSTATTSSESWNTGGANTVSSQG